MSKQDSPPPIEQAACRSCGAPIYWAITRTGARMPVDAAPVADGNVLLALRRSTGEIRAHVLRKHEEPDEGRNRYTAHHATCPDGPRWRKD